MPVRPELGLTSSGWGLPRDLAYSRDPLPPCLPGVRSLIIEERETDGTVCFYATDRKLAGQGKQRVTNFLQQDRWWSEAEKILCSFTAIHVPVFSGSSLGNNLAGII